MAELPSLTKQRGSLKAQITSFRKFVSAIEVPTDIEKINLRKRLTKIESILESFEEIQGKIDQLEPDENKNTQDRENFVNDYYDIISQAEHMLEENERESSKANNSVRSGSVVTNASHISQGVFNVKLPSVSLPEFDGNYALWQQFYDHFVAMIDNNDSLSNVQKLYYLKGQLRGEPAQLINSLKTVDSNYQIAFQALCKRYNKKRKIVDKHVREILNLAPVKNAKESHTRLREFVNNLENNLKCLEALGQPIDSWDAILLPIVLNKLDENLVEDWESKVNVNDPDDLPKLCELIAFLNIKQDTLENMASLQSNSDADRKKSSANKEFNKRRETTKSLVGVNSKCSFCQESHYISNCDAFLKLDTNTRITKAKALNLCLNCLKKGHYIADCKSSKCKTCRRKHHTLLHMHVSNNKLEEAVPQSNSQPSTSSTTLFAETKKEILLSTAEIDVLDSMGRTHKLRALLDSGSQSSFITSRAHRKLNLPCKDTNLTITGLNQEMSSVKLKTDVTIKSRFCKYEARLKCFILENIAGCIPSNHLVRQSFNIPPNIKLADQRFYEPKEIDILIGAELFWELLCIGQFKEPNGPIYQKTKLGWIISGAFDISYPKPNKVCLFSKQLHDSMQKFWTLEEVTSITDQLTEAEGACETLFQQTTTRNDDGKFIVNLPFKENLRDLGNSFNEAKQRFLSL